MCADSIYPPTSSDPLKAVFDYHQATRHRFEGFAPGPGFLDWATQPDPFRRYAGARLIQLETVAPADEPRFDDIFTPGQMPAAALLTMHTISQLFYDSLALSAWKSTGATRWALRVNASSGNLHPTEGYLVVGPTPGLGEDGGVYHYAPREHGLERRAAFEGDVWQRLASGFPTGTLFVGLSSIHWRRSAARFLASSMSRVAKAASSSSTVSWTSRRVSAAMVVSRSCMGFISPSPLKRWTLILPRIPSSFICCSTSSFSSSSRA
jgi:hypothetical protein